MERRGKAVVTHTCIGGRRHSSFLMMIDPIISQPLDTLFSPSLSSGYVLKSAIPAKRMFRSFANNWSRNKNVSASSDWVGVYGGSFNVTALLEWRFGVYVCAFDSICLQTECWYTWNRAKRVVPGWSTRAWSGTTGVPVDKWRVIFELLSLMPVPSRRNRSSSEEKPLPPTDQSG